MELELETRELCEALLFFMTTTCFIDILIGEHLILKSWHLHTKAEGTPFAFAIRLRHDRTASFLNDSFHDCESQSDALTILLCGALELTKLAEQLG